MLKRIYTCDYFLDIVWIYSLEINDGFVAFQKRCLKEKRYRDIFVIHVLYRKKERRPSYFFPTKFVVCCKAFFNFQIQLSVKEESFPFRKVTCNYAFAAENVEVSHIDFGYDGSFGMYVWCDIDIDSDDNDSKRKQTDCFESSVCFSKMRNNLSFSRFCLKCKQTFMRYFTQKLHVIEKNTCFSLTLPSPSYQFFPCNFYKHKN